VVICQEQRYKKKHEGEKVRDVIPRAVQTITYRTRKGATGGKRKGSSDIRRNGQDGSGINQGTNVLHAKLHGMEEKVEKRKEEKA